MTQQRDSHPKDGSARRRAMAWLASGAIATGAMSSPTAAQAGTPAPAVQPRSDARDGAGIDKAAVPAVAVTHAVHVRPGELRVRFLGKETRRPLASWQASIRRAVDESVVATVTAGADGVVMLPGLAAGEHVVVEVARGLVLGLVADEQASVSSLELLVPRSAVKSEPEPAGTNGGGQPRVVPVSWAVMAIGTTASMAVPAGAAINANNRQTEISPIRP